MSFDVGVWSVIKHGYSCFEMPFFFAFRHMMTPTDIASYPPQNERRLCDIHKQHFNVSHEYVKWLHDSSGEIRPPTKISCLRPCSVPCSDVVEMLHKSFSQHLSSRCAESCLKSLVSDIPWTFLGQDAAGS